MEFQIYDEKLTMFAPASRNELKPARTALLIKDVGVVTGPPIKYILDDGSATTEELKVRGGRIESVYLLSTDGVTIHVFGGLYISPGETWRRLALTFIKECGTWTIKHHWAGPEKLDLYEQPWYDTAPYSREPGVPVKLYLVLENDYLVKMPGGLDQNGGGWITDPYTAAREFQIMQAVLTDADDRTIARIATTVVVRAGEAYQLSLRCNSYGVWSMSKLVEGK